MQDCVNVVTKKGKNGIKFAKKFIFNGAISGMPDFDAKRHVHGNLYPYETLLRNGLEFKRSGSESCDVRSNPVGGVFCCFVLYFSVFLRYFDAVVCAISEKKRHVQENGIPLSQRGGMV